MKIRPLTVLILFVGCFLIYDGLHRGTKYWELLPLKPERLMISEVLNLNGRRILPNYVAIGTVEGVRSAITIPIFRDQFRRLRPGDSIGVYRKRSAGQTEWVNQANVEESKPIIGFLGLHFTWHFPTGVLMAVYASICLRKELCPPYCGREVNHPDKRS